MINYNSTKNKSRQRRKVAFYGRVSTEHEEQLNALRNQMQWYEELSRSYPEWDIIELYMDEGITGTQTNKRPEFMRMIDDAFRGKFDLIVTREVSRFARNTIDCLEMTRKLRNSKVEVFFVQEGIWTMDNEGEMNLTIRAMVAQEESRKMSERVKAGQEISRANGVLYGNGNVLGYDRVGSTYVINEDQAETVRMIYNLYESGLGMQAIRNELIRAGRKAGNGKVSWDTTKIMRVLRNTIYKGVMGYKKSQRNNFLDQKTIINRDESTYMYVKGNFEPIISEEQWEHCRQIRESRTRVRLVEKGGELTIEKKGFRVLQDIWSQRLRCACGSSMRRNKWRKRNDGTTPVGYRCYSQLNKGANQVSKDNTIACTVHSVCGWKLELMAEMIFKKILKNEKLFDRAVKKFVDSRRIEENEIKRIKGDFYNEIKAISGKVNRLIDMRMEGELSKEEYLEMRGKVEEEKKQAEQRLADFEKQVEDRTNLSVTQEEGRELLTNMIKSGAKFVEDLVSVFVSKIQVVSDTEFVWLLSLNTNNDIMEENSFDLLVKYNDALAFRKKRKEMLRENQWSDLKVKCVIL